MLLHDAVADHVYGCQATPHCISSRRQATPRFPPTSRCPVGVARCDSRSYHHPVVSCFMWEVLLVEIS